MYTYHRNELKQMFDVTDIVTIFKNTVETNEYMHEDEINDFCEFIYVEKGELRVRIGTEIFVVHENQLIFYPPGIPHKWLERSSEKCRIWVAAFECCRENMQGFYHKVFCLSNDEKRMMYNAFEHGTRIFKWLSGAGRGMCTADNTSPEALYNLKLILESFLLLLHTNNSNKSTQTIQKHRNAETVNRIIAFLHMNIRENITIGQIANEFGKSPSALKKIFREYTGGGIIDYFIDLKIEYAKEMIGKGEKNFAEIAEWLGFSSQFYFSRVFKKRTGVSPSKYSKKI